MGGREDAVASEDAHAAELATRVRAGEAEAFEALHRRYFERVFAYVSLLAGAPDAAEEVAGRSFVELHDQLVTSRAGLAHTRVLLFSGARRRGIAARGAKAARAPTRLRRTGLAAIDAAGNATTWQAVLLR